MLSDILYRVKALFRRNIVEGELDDELRFHLNEQVEKYARSGLSRAEAERRARLEFGGVESVKEECREARGVTAVETTMQDVRYAIRTLRKSPAFTALTVLSLALGIGANTAIFSFMDAILLRSLPVSDPGSLAILNWRAKAFQHGGPGRSARVASVVQTSMGRIDDDPHGGVISDIFPYPALEFLGKNNAVFSALFGYCPSFGLNVKVRGEAELGSGEYVSGDYFRGLGVPPAAGRLITSDDDRGGAPPVAVVSFAYSQKRFGDPSKAVGATISVNNVLFTVVGVTAPEFFGVDPAAAPDVYFPMHALSSAETLLDPHSYWLQMMARLRRGVNRSQAQAAVAAMFQKWVAATAADDKERANLPELVLVPGGTGVDSLRLRYSAPLLLLLALVGLILAIACANTANLLLARAAARRREIAVRLSVGAGRLRLIRQLLTESVLLASLGGALGIALAFWGVRVLTLLLANGEENFTLRAELNWHVLAVAVALSVLSGVLFGLAPAIQSTRVDVMPALKDDLRSSRQPSARLRFLIAAQLAIALLVLVAAGLFTRTLSNLNAIQLGFNRDNLLLFEVDAEQAGHRDPEIADFYRNLQTDFQAIPGVRNATLSNLSIMAGGTMFLPFKVRGKPIDITSTLDVGPSFLTTMQIPVLIGHDIEDRGRAAALVDEDFAKMYFPAENPVGQHIAAPHYVDDVEIVGVSANAKYGDFRGQSKVPVVYLLYSHVSRPPITQMIFELRTAGNPLSYAKTVREIVRKADPGVPVSNIKTQAAEVEERVNQETIFARLSTLFAFLALAITCVGLYGVVSYNVAQRTNEIGIRMALGAQRAGVIRMILRDVLTTVLLGLAAGVPGALLASKFVSAFLYGIKPNDPLNFATAVGILLFAVLLAGYAPARRASRTEPMAALRHE